MAERPLCDFCARPVATQVDFDATSEGDRPELCWGAFDAQECETVRIEDGGWRAKAEKAEAELAAARARIGNAEHALVGLHESLFIGSERGLSKDALRGMATYAKEAAAALSEDSSGG